MHNQIYGLDIAVDSLQSTNFPCAVFPPCRSNSLIVNDINWMPGNHNLFILQHKIFIYDWMNKIFMKWILVAHYCHLNTDLLIERFPPVFQFAGENCKAINFPNINRWKADWNICNKRIFKIIFHLFIWYFSAHTICNDNNL